MTKTEFLGQGIADLRVALQDIFEDPDGELGEMTKPHLIKFAKQNWDTVEGWYNTTDNEEGEPVSQEEMDETPLDPEPELSPVGSPVTPDQSNPTTNLA